jgi:hypothetical protein
VRIDQAFGTEMAIDTEHETKEGYVWVKKMDGSPPEPNFLRVMTYTLGDNPQEYLTSTQKGETTGQIRAGSYHYVQTI